MTQQQVISGVLVDEMQLTIDEFAYACQRNTQWVLEHIDAELIQVSVRDEQAFNFSSTNLIRARRLANIETMFEANEEVAALVVDLIEEIVRLKRALSLAQID